MNMLHRALLALWSLTLCAFGAEKPNIIVILVDDMGWSDIGCYGGEIPTPNIDALAKGGLRFTRFYNTGRCCPTRASLLTGLYPHQAGVGHMTEEKPFPGYRGRLNENCVTMAEVLGGAGYFTTMAGKWHIGQSFGVVPWERGFMRSIHAPAGGFYQDGPRAKLFLNGKQLANDDPALPKNWYTTDLWTDYGIRFIDEAREEKKPFFLYLAHNAPHFPLQAPADEIAKFRHGIYLQGWDKLREARHARQKEFGLIDPATPLSPRSPMVAAWDTISEEEKDRFDHMMAVYAACVAHVDKSVGVLVDALKKRGEFDNTLIFFLSDNGGNAESGPKGRSEGDPAKAGSTWFCGQSWAGLENTPFRFYKHFNHEGGISTPLIAHWPAGIKTPGEFRRQPGHLIDIMATVADVGSATYPKEFKGHAIPPMEGRSLVPAFGNQAIERDALFWEHEGNAAISIGDWKLVRKGGKGSWELYNLEKDRAEMNDLTAAEPQRVEAMRAKWMEWAKRAQVIPGPPAFSGDGTAAGAAAKDAAGTAPGTTSDEAPARPRAKKKKRIKNAVPPPQA
jgi:arylsulfatase A-like enzyme